VCYLDAVRTWTFGRHWMLLFLLYIGADFLDPSIPGVFFLDNDALYVDGVIHTNGHHGLTPAQQGHAPYPAELTQLVSPRPVPSRPMLDGLALQWRVKQTLPRHSVSGPASPRATEDH
jgi:hypothetical protein